MRILNWNTEWASPRGRNHRFARIQQLIAGYDADVICLTEARPETMPDGGQTISSELSGAGNVENRAGRKVVLWSRSGWRSIDTTGSDKLPEGRFVSATTKCNGFDISFVGMCIPYAHYRNHKNWGDRRKTFWQGACEYLDALREDVLSREQFRRPAVLLGDFNMQIPPHRYPGKNSDVNRKREATFAGWSIPTAGEIDDPALDKRFIDHIALTPDIRLKSLRFISRFHANGARLSDHNGVCIEVAPARADHSLRAISIETI